MKFQIWSQISMGFYTLFCPRLVIFMTKNFLLSDQRCAGRQRLDETCPAVCATPLTTEVRVDGGVGHDCGELRGVRALRRRSCRHAQRVLHPLSKMTVRATALEREWCSSTYAPADRVLCRREAEIWLRITIDSRRMTCTSAVN